MKHRKFFNLYGSWMIAEWEDNITPLWFWAVT